MTRKILLYFILAFASVLAKKQAPKRHRFTMEWRMETYKIVPYVFPAGPADSAFVKYPIHGVRGRPNQILSHEDAEKKPTIYWNALAKGYYTLAMVVTDYDVEGDSDYYKEYVHWLVVNIPGRRIRYGKPLVKYNIPPKPYNNGTSFMVFLMYKQKEKFNRTVLETSTIHNDGSFKIFNFCWYRDMKYPDAGMFFRLRYDVYANRTTTEATLPTTKRRKKKKN